MEKIRVTDNLTGESELIEQPENAIPTIETPTGKTIEEKYDELQLLVAELLEVL